jgi:copper chaperone CopZ
MKTLKKIVLLGVAAILILFIHSAKAQDSTTTVLKIKTSAICKMCKKTIEKALANESGIIKSDLEVKSKIATVTYNPKKTTPEKIRKAIADSGYDADDVPANPKAYKKLENCCKKENSKHE